MRVQWSWLPGGCQKNDFYVVESGCIGCEWCQACDERVPERIFTLLAPGKADRACNGGDCHWCGLQNLHTWSISDSGLHLTKPRVQRGFWNRISLHGPLRPPSLSLHSLALHDFYLAFKHFGPSPPEGLVPPLVPPQRPQVLGDSGLGQVAQSLHLTLLPNLVEDFLSVIWLFPASGLKHPKKMCKKSMKNLHKKLSTINPCKKIAHKSVQKSVPMVSTVLSAWRWRNPNFTIICVRAVLLQAGPTHQEMPNPVCELCKKNLIHCSRTCRDLMYDNVKKWFLCVFFPSKGCWEGTEQLRSYPETMKKTQSLLLTILYVFRRLSMFCFVVSGRSVIPYVFVYTPLSLWSV